MCIYSPKIENLKLDKVNDKRILKLKLEFQDKELLKQLRDKFKKMFIKNN